MTLGIKTYAMAAHSANSRQRVSTTFSPSMTRIPFFDLTRNVITAILISVGLMVGAICLFAVYLRWRYGPGRPRVPKRAVRSRTRHSKPGKTLK